MFQRFYDEGLAQSSFFLACPRTREAVIIDPRRDVDVYVETARANNLRITHTFETHVHADFACGSRELAAVGAKTISGPGSNLRYAHHQATHGERLRVGDLSIEFMHTPGHTPEHLSILTSQPDQPVRLFTGDTLFVGAVGRPDLLGEEQTRRLAGDLYDSLFKKILVLDERIQVHPGHGAGSLCGAGIGNDPFTTIGQEKRFNPMLQHATKEAFVAAVLADLPDTPPYFPRMKKLNQEGPPLLGLVNGYRGPGSISPGSAASAIRGGALMIDLRGASAFGASHPLGALNLAFGPKLGYWAGYVLPADARVVLLAANQQEATDAGRQLLRIGVSRIDGYVNGGFEAWCDAGLPAASIPLTNVQDLHGAMSHGNPPLIVDVRTPREWKAGHIAGAVHIPLGDLARRASELPRDRTVATICEAGYRSSLAASVLARAGVDRLMNVTGGMSAWRALQPTSVSS
ncbi:MAG TPA: rhodanese-like domain-containing protein [Vicinamibacterales bacterium]|nr:rhodanese-like domain-containing protein [Vicinamibacterales bacterium]